MDLDDGVAEVVLAAEELLELELVERGDGGGKLGLQLGEGVVVTLVGQLDPDLALLDLLALGAEAVDGRLDAGVLPRDRLRPRGVVPEVGRRRLLAQLRCTLFECREVKDASRARSRAGAAPARRLEAHRAG
jgi:hypothetical protein